MPFGLSSAHQLLLGSFGTGWDAEHHYIIYLVNVSLHECKEACDQSPTLLAALYLNQMN